MRADDRERCLELCRAEDPLEYPLFENANMDAFLIQVERQRLVLACDYLTSPLSRVLIWSVRNAVQIQLGASPLVAEALRPRVVLDAAVFCKEELMEQPDGHETDGPCWQTMQGFGEVSKSKSYAPYPIRPRTCTVAVLVLANPSSGILVCEH